MTEYFLITVLAIYGVHASTRDGMILGNAYMWLFFKLSRRVKDPSMILKPLFDCTPCMASVYGTISFFVGGFPSLVWLPAWVFSLCGFNYILNKILNGCQNKDA